MNRFNFITIFFFFFISCDSHIAIDSNSFSTWESQEMEEFSLPYDGYSLINLSNKNGFQFGDVTKVRFADNRIILLDKEISHTIFVWDSTGKPLFKISQELGGPDEVRQIYDFCVNIQQNKLYVLDPTIHKIKCFSLKDGIFLYSYPLNSHFYNIEVLDNQQLILHVKNNYSNIEPFQNARFAIYDLDNKSFDYLQVQIDPSNEFMKFGVNENVFISSGLSIFSTEILCDTIYTFNNQEPLCKSVLSMSWPNEQQLNAKDNPTMERFLENKSKKSYHLGTGTVYYDSTFHVFTNIRNHPTFFAKKLLNGTASQYKRMVLKCSNNYILGLPLAHNTGVENSLAFFLPEEYFEIVQKQIDPDLILDKNVYGNDILLVLKKNN